MGMINPQLFLAHSSADKDLVRRLAIDLVARDISVWFDEWEIRVGHSLMDQIEAGITSSAYLGIVLSGTRQPTRTRESMRSRSLSLATSC